MQQPIVSESTAHICSNVSCKCHAEGEMCSEYCKNFSPDEGINRCGCGHSACDATKQIGNDETFGATGFPS